MEPIVLLVSQDSNTASAVNQALAANNFKVGDRLSSLSDMVTYLQSNPAPAALIDIDPDPPRMLEELDSITGRFLRTRFIVLSRELNSDWILKAMQAGARHFLAKKSLVTELAAVLHKLLPSEGMSSSPGGVVTVLSAAGGCGATTLATNLAHELHAADGESVLLVDMDMHYRAITLYLGLKEQYGLSDILARTSRIDHHLILSTAVTFAGLKVLAGPAEGAVAPTAAQLDAAIQAFRHSARYTVIDAPRVAPDVRAVLARQSLLTLVLFQLNVKDINRTQQILASLQESGVNMESVVPLASRCDKKAMVSPQEAQRALGGIPIEKITNDFRSATRAMNYGKPLAQAAPRSELHQDVQRLARQVADVYRRHARTGGS